MWPPTAHFLLIPPFLLPTTSGAVNNGGLALSADGQTLYVVLNMRNSVGVIDLTSISMRAPSQCRNAPKSIVVMGNHAYVTNQGGRPANPGSTRTSPPGLPLSLIRNLPFPPPGQ